MTQSVKRTAEKLQNRER